MVITLNGWCHDRYPGVASAMLIEVGLSPVGGVFRYSGFDPYEDISDAQIAAIAGYFAPMTLDDAKAAKRAEIAAARYAAEIAGVAVGGVVVKTDRESQALITGAALKATQDGTYSCTWKTESGFVTLDAATVLAVADAVRTHVQTCFDAEAAKCMLIDAAQTAEDVEAVAW